MPPNPLECPFCGGAAETLPAQDGPRKVFVGCLNERCLVRPATSGATESVAVAKWNDRAVAKVVA